MRHCWQLSPEHWPDCRADTLRRSWISTWRTDKLRTPPSKLWSCHDPGLLVRPDRHPSALSGYDYRQVSRSRLRAERQSGPRAFLNTLEGWRKRANNAQLNGFEVTPAFAAAVIIAHQAGGAGQTLLDQLAVAFIVSRLLYFVCYLAGWGPLRSLVWFVGMGLIVALFVVSA